MAQNLGIDRTPETWSAHWQAFEEWKSSGGCDAEIGAIPSNAVDVFGLPTDCMDDLQAVCDEIRRNPALAELASLWHFLLFHQPGTRALSEDAMPAPTGVHGERAHLVRVAVLVSGTGHALRAFSDMGVSEQIALDSLRQCGSQMIDHRERYGVYGMRYLGWMRNYFNALMFRLGRLVFNPNTYTWAFHVYRHRSTGALQTMCAAGHRYRSDGMADGCNDIKDPDAWTSELDIGADAVRGNPVSPTGEAVREQITLDLAEWEPLITPGDDMIEIHIPGYNSGGRMMWEDCVASYVQALDFFPRYYPQTNFTSFTCWSWLLDPALSRILPPGSNIAKFQSPFHLLPVYGNHVQCYDLAFGNAQADLSTFTPKTSLQRAICDYVRAGNMMRSTAGYITMDEMRMISR